MSRDTSKEESERAGAGARVRARARVERRSERVSGKSGWTNCGEGEMCALFDSDLKWS